MKPASAYDNTSPQLPDFSKRGRGLPTWLRTSKQFQVEGIQQLHFKTSWSGPHYPSHENEVKYDTSSSECTLLLPSKATTLNVFGTTIQKRRVLHRSETRALYQSTGILAMRSPVEAGISTMAALFPNLKAIRLEISITAKSDEDLNIVALDLSIMEQFAKLKSFEIAVTVMVLTPGDRLMSCVREEVRRVGELLTGVAAPYQLEVETKPYYRRFGPPVYGETVFTLKFRRAND